jgi:DEAD/DEAH box helicase domain-containing protein
MSLRIFKLEEYDHTHEREQFRNLCSILKDLYDKSAEMHLLFANINFNGVPLDALLIKPDAITVLEFKNYSGNVIAAENGDWKLDDGTIIKGGMGKNPFVQTKNNKFAVITTLNTWFPSTHVNLGHTSGIVVFNQPVTVDDHLISPKSKSWFHICDMDHISDKISDITSPAIHYTNSDLDKLPQILNCDDPKYIIYESSGAPQAGTLPQNTTPISPTTPKNKLSDKIRTILSNNGYMIVHEIDKPGKVASYHVGAKDLGQRVEDYVNRNYQGKLYEHQYAAAKLVSENKNVCITTSTSSGKTAIFHMAALEILEKDPNARIIAVYPMRALGSQQVDSWQNKLKDVKCGRIDGTIDPSERLRILKECSVITFTPDTVHTFLLGKLKDDRFADALKKFLANLKLVIIDEVHLYRGMLGSNSAYLFRRLNSCTLLAGGKLPQYITASATINDPVQHSSDISGIDKFDIIGPNMDTSPSCPTKIFLIGIGKGLSNLLTELTSGLPDNCHSITFIDSRKDVVQVALDTEKALNMQQIGIYPFKSGLEAEDYNNILNVLGTNKFKGVVSTSSLEVGIDIGALNVAILNGIPNSSTSFYQRIGRVGRGGTNDEAVVIIMDNPNSIVTKRLFNDPQKLLSLPPEEPALYLDNKNLVNIQALHFVGDGLEFQSVANKNWDSDFKRVAGLFPIKFSNICHDILNNQFSADYQQFMGLGGNYPEIVFTLRQFDVQYKAYERNNPDQGLGELNMQNVLREAYPEAVYIYLRIPRRVVKVDKMKHEIILERLRGNQSVSTKPRTGVLVTPQKSSQIHGHIRFGQLHVMNLGLSEFTTIKGYKEYIRFANGGAIENIKDYPGDYWKQNSFNHTMLTEGVIITHPLMTSKIQRSLVAHLLYEVFLSSSAFERSDIEYCSGTLNTDIGVIKANTSFITIYDKIIGGLNITSRLMDPFELKRGFAMMVDLIDNGLEQDILGVALNQPTKNAIHKMFDDISGNKPEEVGLVAISEYHIARNSEAYYLPDPSDADKKEQTTIDMVYLDNKNNEITYDVITPDGTLITNVPEAQVLPISGISYKGRFVGVRSINTKTLW